MIGPEGDFSKNEEEVIKKHNFEYITLGPYTLRAETAALTAIAGINANFGYKNITT